MEAAHTQVLAQVQEAVHSLKEECTASAQQQGVLLRSNIDQIASSRTFLETKLQGETNRLFKCVGVAYITIYI